MKSMRTLPGGIRKSLSVLLCLVILLPFVLLKSAGTAAAATTWNAPASNNETNQLNGIRYGNGLWVAPGAYSHYATSSDGANWTDRTISGATTLNDAFYAGQWVIAGSLGKLYSSPDGTTWTAQTSNTSQNLWSLYGNGSTFVAVGDAGTIVTGNGTTFSAQTAGTQSFYGVTYGGGQFVAVGAAGTIYTSPDGSAWTNRSPGGNDLFAAAYYNGLYVAVGMSGTIRTSADGVTWTPRTSGVSLDLNGVEHGPGKWVAVGLGGNIISSVDGITWTAETSGTTTDIWHVAQGNTLWVAVGASGLIRTQVALSNNANLSNLTLSQGTLTPAFAAGTTSYTASVPYTTTSVNVTATVADATATLTVNGTATASGSPATVNLNVGSNPISVVVTAQDGVTTKTYTVTVTRAAPSTNANLSNLTLSQGTLTPAFAAGTTGYTASVANSVTSVNVTPTVADSTATVKVNNTATASGSPVSVPLNVGSNAITVVVTAQDGTTQKTYTVTVTRLSNNANLSNLTISAGTLSPAFAAGTTGYTASVAYGTSSLSVTPTVADATATLQVNGSAATSGNPATVTLSVGANAITVLVTAQDGTTKTYTVTVTRAPASTNANLSSLTLSAGTLSPAFASGTASYSATVPGGTGSINVTPTAADSHATLTVNGSAVVSGNAVPVSVSANGATTVTVVVTAEDGTTTTTYTVTIWPGPAFTGAATNTAQLVSVGGALTALQVSAIPGASLTFTMTGGALPPGITLNADGTFSGTVTTPSTTSATITVADTHGGQANTTLTVTVQAAPAFTAAATNTSQFISASAGLTALQATRAAGETLTFSKTGGALPAGITLNSDGTFSGVATTPGDTTATITAADTHGGVAITTLAVTVQVGPAYTADAGNTAQTVSVGVGLTALQATGAAGETLTFTLTAGNLPAGITLNADGTFSGTTTTVGSTTATIHLTDTHGGKADTTLAVTVQAAPAFTAATTNTSQTVSVTGTPVALQVTKAAGETLTFTLTGGALPAGISLNGDGSFSGAITALGDTTATIRVADTHGGLATTTLAITVQDGPAYTADATNTAQLVSTGAGLTALTATAAAGETLTFTVAGGTLPAGVTLNAGGTFSGTATTAGNYSATIQVADTHGGHVTTTLAVTVQPAPAFTAAATNTSQTASIGAGLTALQVSYAAGESITFTLTGGALPDGITLNANGTFSGTVTTVGSTSATIHVADTHGGQATTTLAVTVQAGPAFTGAATNTSQFISASAGLTALQATKAAGETLTFSKTGGVLPAGISLNSDGTFSGAATTPGDTTATITAADTHGGVATTTLAVTVQVGPAYTADASNTAQTVSVGVGLTALQATKAAGETLTFTKTAGALPAGISLNADGSFSGTATTVGNTIATIQVADTHGGHATTTLAVTVQPAPAFTAATTNTSQLVSVGAGLTALAVTKAAGETLTFTLTGGALPNGISLNADGTFSGTATTTGATTGTIGVADTHGGAASTTLAVTVQVAPAFTADAANTSQLISTGAGLAALHATAAAGETLTFSVSGGTLPNGISLGADGTFTGTATTAGAFSATVRAADTHGGRATTTLAVTVQPGPTFTADAANTAQLVSVGAPVAALQTTSAAGETLTFTLTGGVLPAGISLNSDGTFSGTVTTVGVTTATIHVADTHGGAANTALTVTVQQAPAYTAAATNTSQFISTSASLTALQVSAAAGETLTFTLTGGALPAGISLNSDGTFSGAATTVGATSATIRATDTHGGLAATTLAVTVQQGPAFTADTANTSQLVSTGVGLAALTATKAAGETLTFTRTGGALPAGISLNADGTFTGTATTAGDTTATIQAADTHGGHVTTTLAVTVQPAPAFTGDGDNTAQLVSVGADLSALKTTKAAGETLTFALTGGALPAGITLNADGTFSGTVTTVGSTTATIRVADTHGGQATTALAVTVQAAPAFTAATANTTQFISTSAGLAALQATAAVGETLTFTLTGGTLPAGISLNGDGTFSGTATTTGDTTATLQAADTHGGKATTTLAVTVQPGPAYTAALSNSAQLVSAGAGLSALQVTKAPGETLTFALTAGALPAGISLNADGTFTGTATTVGATSATIRVADTHGGQATTALMVTVQEAPAFTAAAANTAQVISTGVGLTALDATVAAGDTLTFTLTGGALPAGISLNADGTFSGTATAAGTPSATIQAADTHGGKATTTLAVTVRQGPVFTAALSNTAQSILTGGTLVALQATAGADPTLTFAVMAGNLPTGVTLNADGSFTGTATASGHFSATIAVVDALGGRAVTNLAVTVSTPGGGGLPAPTFTVSGGVVITATPALTGSTNLPDGTAVQVAVDGSTYGGSVSGGAWSATVTAPLSVGVHSVTVSGQNASGVSGSASGSITVKVAPTVALLADQTSKQGDRVELGVSATGAPGSRFTYAASGLPDGLGINAATGVISGNTTKDGIYAVTVTVTETVAGGVTSQSFTWRVLKPNTGTAGGTVTDAVTGQPISGATVTLTQGGQRTTTTTDSAGTYSFARVNSLLTYTLKVSHPAYLPESRGPLDLKPGEAIDQSFQLTPLGSLRITSPAGGDTLTAPPTAATGTVTGGGTVQVELNGTPAGAVAVSASGTWQVDLSGAAGLLVVGTNTVRATEYGANNRVIAAASVDFAYAPKGSLAGTVRTDTGRPAPGIALQVLDGSGKQVAVTTTAADGTYSFRDLPVGSFTLLAGTVSTQVAVTAGQTTRQDLVVAGQVNLSISVAPASIVGDGKATATVTVSATTSDGKSAAGVNVQIGATAGTLSAASVTTGAQGTATVALTAPLLSGIAARDGRVTATFRDAQGVSAETSAVVRFVPAAITGRVVSGNTGAALAGARVWVAEDFNGDGVIDFTAETTTAADGTYTIYVPRSNWQYQVHVTATTQVNGRPVTIESVQDGTVGQVTTLGQTFATERRVSGQLLVAATGGAPAQQPDQALTHGEMVTASLQRTDTGETQSVTVSPQGGFAVGNLNPGQYRLTLRVTAPDGQQLAGTAVNLAVTQSGEMTVETALIDPYGTVTDAATGQPVAGAQMTLMWADTPLNRSNGRTPDTPVNLPALPDFAPNRNADPQITTADGQFAWMVFPQGDYYILARKDGYRDYDSRQEGRNVAGTDSYVQGGIIHVGESLVSYSFVMNAVTGGGTSRHTRYIHGYPDGTFGPNRNITRAEVATVLAQLLGAAPGAGPGPQFTDVSAGHWATGSIASVAARGIMVGDPDGRFRPDAPVTRAEVAVIVSRLRQLAPGSTSFPDVAGHWAAGYIAAAQTAGILTGYPDGTFQPQRPTTRAEFVTVINRTLQRGPLVGVTAPTFPDVPLDSWASGMVEEAATDHTYVTGADGKEHLVP